MKNFSIQRSPKCFNDSYVLAFCELICVGAHPIRLPIRPEQYCLPNECFQNVLQKVEKDGGRIRYGWALWEWPRVFIEAEHHAIYESHDGTLIDITPALEGWHCSTRVFLPDDSALYDYNNPGIRRDNIRQPLTTDSKINEYISLAKEVNAILNKVPGFGIVTIKGSDAARLNAVREKMHYLWHELAFRYTPQNAPCFCGSGIKFKRCHGQTA